MLKKVLISLLLILSFFFPNKVQSAGEFATDIAVEYKVEETGLTQVTHRIAIENLFSNLYATSYSLVLDNIDPQNVSAFEGSTKLSVVSKKEADKVNLTVNFPDALVGKGKTRNFSVVFTEPG
ncbi:MAG: hypothetical protein ACOYT7_02890, partial [Patescibacteria group bacterium]